MLQVKDLEVSYGAIRALSGVNLEVARGEIVTIVGANGAGKSSLLNTVAGMVRPAGGEVSFEGQRLRPYPHLCVKRGVALVPEGRRVFGNLTIRENLIMGAYLRNDSGGIAQDMGFVFELFPRLKERESQMASTLSGGEQQMLVIGRALMSRPRLLLLDEPSLGLAPKLVKEIFTTLRDINDKGVTVLLVEQNAQQALALAGRAYVFQNGRVVKAGFASELAKDPAIQQAYLGVRREKSGQEKNGRGKPGPDKSSTTYHQEA